RGSALRVEFRAEDHRLQLVLRRRSGGADAAHQRTQDQAGDRQGAAACRSARRTAADRRPRGDRQGRGDAVNAYTFLSSSAEADDPVNTELLWITGCPPSRA